MPKDELKEAIKNITGPEASYNDIMKAMDYFNKLAILREKAQ